MENHDFSRVSDIQQEYSHRENKAHHLLSRKVTCAALSAILILGSCSLTYAVTNQNSASEAAQVTALSSAASDSAVMMTPREVYANNYQAIVSVSGTVKVTSSYSGQVATGTVGGSGFIISSDGYIVTNYHVVEGTQDLTVTLSTDEEYSAKVVGYDSTNDVAVLKIDANSLPCVKLGSSEDLYIGDMVVAIGNPLGSLTATLTVGYISGKDREVTTDNTIINMLQTDAAINSGSSGGPLFNMYGEVVGITTAKYSGTSSSGASIEGVSFAIPIDDVMRVITDLRDYGYVTGAYLGITVQDSDSSAAAYYGLPTGAYVVSVVDGYAAAEAGLNAKDIIVALGDYDVTNTNDLTRALRHFNSGDTTTISVYRNGQRLTMSITLSERPQDLNSSSAGSTDAETQATPSTGDYNEWYDYFFGKKNGN